MRRSLITLTLALSAVAFAPQAFASKVLPDACGADKVKFNITTSADSPALVAPEGKSLLVFISTVQLLFPPAVRYGVDGVWAGAAKNKNYITYAVAPGEHHLCFTTRGLAGASSVTTEAGKIYYFEFHVELHTGSIVGGSSNGGMVMSSPTSGFSQINDDQGKFLVKKYDHVISTPNK